MRLSIFWDRMDEVLGPAYARSWADHQVLAELDGRTVTEALTAGEDAKTVWRAVWANLGLSPQQR